MKHEAQNNDWLEQQLRNLPETASEAMGGLTAGTELNQRIQMAVREARAPKQSASALFLRRFAPAAALCTAAVALFVGLSPLLTNQQPSATPLIQTSTLGNPDTPDATEPVLRADLNEDDVTVSSRKAAPSYRSIWSKSSGGSFPLIGVNGSYYRMLTSPRDVSSSLLGNSVGAVAEYTTEPSLSGTDVILSNTALSGTTVYEISGMGGTLVAAEVDGKTRLFQRVSFNGHALLGAETLADTLQISGHVTAIELSDVGTVTDTDACADLISILMSNATYESSGSISAKQSLIIDLDNGLVVQMNVKSDKLAACGTWSCPEFFEAFEAYCD